MAVIKLLTFKDTHEKAFINLQHQKMLSMNIKFDDEWNFLIQFEKGDTKKDIVEKLRGLADGIENNENQDYGN